MIETWERLAATRIVTFLTVVAVIAGFLQAPLSVLSQDRVTLYFDDISVILAFVAVLALAALSLRGLPVIGVGIWLVALFAALYQTTAIDRSDAISILRQVAYPAMLILVGLCIQTKGLRKISRIAIIIAVVNALYAPFELTGHKVLDPTKLLSTSTDNIAYLIHGLPGYYWIQLGGLGSRVVERAGGFVLNPPICGLVTGYAFAAAWHDRNLPFRSAVLYIVGIGTLLTFSRGGILVAVAGAFLPLVVRWLGRSAGLVAFAVGGLFVGAYVAGQGGSAAHSNGLLVGLLDAIHFPTGRGFGYTGNLAKILGVSSTGESLSGIAFSAAGLVEVALVVALFVALWRRLRGVTGEYAAIGVATVIGACVSETAGALNATIPMWLTIGVALSIPLESRPLLGANFVLGATRRLGAHD